MTKSVSRRSVLATAALAPTFLAQPFTRSEPAWEAYQDGMALYRAGTPQSLHDALAAFRRALTADPQMARAAAMVSAVYRQRWTLGLVDDWSQTEVLEKDAYDWARRALMLARAEAAPQPSMVAVLNQWGLAQLYRRDYAGARHAVSTLMAHTPPVQEGWGLLAMTACYQGRLVEALDASTRELSLVPPTRRYFALFHRGAIFYSQGEHSGALDDYTLAVTCLRDALADNPTYRSARVLLTAALMAMGDPQAAQAQWQIARLQGRPSALDPQAQAHFAKAWPYADETITRQLLARLAAAEEGLA